MSLTVDVSKLLTRIRCRSMENKTEVLIDDQFGFSEGKGTRESVLTLCQVMEARLKIYQNIFLEYVDLEEAFENVKCCNVFEILRKMGPNNRDMRVIYVMYNNLTKGVRFGLTACVIKN